MRRFRNTGKKVDVEKRKRPKKIIVLSALAAFLPLASNAETEWIGTLKERMNSERIITKQFNAGLLTRIFIKRGNWKELRKLLAHKDPYVAGAVIRTFRKAIYDPRVVGTKWKEISKGEKKKWIRVLQYSDDKNTTRASALNYLFSAVEDPSPLVKVRVLRILKYAAETGFDITPAVDKIFRLRRDNDKNVGKAAEMVLQKAGDNEKSRDAVNRLFSGN